MPFPALVVAVTAVSAGIAYGFAPGHWPVIGGVALGTGVAGLFAAVALGILRRARARGGAASPRVINAFVGLMLGRMIGYLAFLGVVVAVGLGQPVSVCIGLLAGTVVFQTIEIVYLRKML